MLKPDLQRVYRNIHFLILVFLVIVKESTAVPVTKSNDICEVDSTDMVLLKNATVVYTRVTNSLTAEFPIEESFLFMLEHYICPREDDRKPATQECFKKHPIKLTHVTYTTTSIIGVVILPTDMDCSHCVVQWIIKPLTLTSGASQKNFAVCYNISLESQSKDIPLDKGFVGISNDTTPTSETNLTCTGNDGYGEYDELDTWCSKHCSAGNCLEKYCICEMVHEVKMEHACRPSPLFKGLTNLGQWCDINCKRGFCPYTHCDCSPTPSPTTPGTTTPGTTPTTTPAPVCGPIHGYEVVSGMKLWCEFNCKAGYCPDSHCLCVPGGGTTTAPP